MGKLISQPVTTPPNFPQGIDPSKIPQSQLPQFRDRVKQLRDAGVSETEILKRLQSQSNGIPGVTQPVNSAQNPSQNPSNNNSTNNEPKDITLEGTESVIDEEDTEYQDKPQNMQAYLGPPILSNVYGHQIFADTTGRFTQAINPAPSPDYIVGPGDVFTVTIWGCSELSESLVIAKDGSVRRTYMGKVYLGGLSYSKAQEILLARYKGIVSSCSQIEVFMGKSRRVIHVNIVGEVFNPRSYQINAAVPAFNALFEARGITDIGSVRNIQIKRGGRTVDVLDIYDYIIKGKNEPIYLQDNDFIYVPVQEKIVEVQGAVKRPMEYELEEGENLKALLEFSGGLNYDAMRSDAQVARLQSEREVLINFPLDSIMADRNKDFRIEEGDKLIIKTLNKGAFNTVQAFGNLEYPGTYQLLPGERVSDLIARAGGLGIDAYKDRAYVVRIVPGSNEVIYIPVNLNEVYDQDNPIHNLELQFFDALIVFSESEFQEERYIEISGMIREPGIFNLSPTMTLKDLFFLTGGPREDADLENIELSVVTRADHLAPKFLNEENALEEGVTEEVLEPIDIDPEDEIVRRISIDKDWRNDPTLDTLLIYDFDQVRIYSKFDFKNFKFIEVIGAIKNPGKFQIKKGMTIKDLLYRAGGLSADADVNEIELYQDIDYEEMGHYGVNTDREEIIRIRIEKNWQQGAITDTFSVEGFKRMIVRSEDEFFNQGYVTVKGLVNSPGRYKVRPNMTLLDVFYQSGGLKISADFDRVELSRVIEVLNDQGVLMPVPIDISTIMIDQNWQQDSVLRNTKINSFDQVFVRKNPLFELQESVYVMGEVITPGEYNKSSKAEKVSSLVGRAGGITKLAYLEGAYINRMDIGKMSIKLDKALKRKKSKFDIPLLVGDTLVIPARTDIIRIDGNVLQPGTAILYNPNKRKFKYYVRLAGGFDRRSKKKLSTVSYVDGRVRGVRNFLFFRKYPKLEQGSLITVARKPDREKKDPSQRNRLSLQEVLASATSILTFWVLIDRVRNN